MSETQEPTPAKVIPLHAAPKSMRASERKWGKAVMDRGYCIVPSLLLRAQHRLGLNATQLTLIFHLIDYWWEKERNPYPTRDSIATRMGLSERQLTRYIKQLHDAGLVQRIEQTKAGKGQTSNQYDLSGLVAKLQALEPEFRQADEARKSVSRRGGLALATAAAS